VTRDLLIAWAISAVCFTAVWAVSVRIRNYGLLDAAWSYGVAIIGPFLAWRAGAGAFAWAFTAVGVAWSLRLGTHILVRVLRYHPAEDHRYQTLRERWPGPARFWLFFQLQAALVVIFTLPFAIVAHDATPAWRAIQAAGVVVAAVAIAGESLADAQLAAFKRDARSRGRVCDVGLWGWSRHPNYFFEFLFWCGAALAAIPAPWGWLAIVCPALMFYFLFRVTGIPLTEEHAVARKGDAYREYQRRVSAFVPRRPAPCPAPRAPGSRSRSRLRRTSRGPWSSLRPAAGRAGCIAISLATPRPTPTVARGARRPPQGHGRAAAWPR
jgi:steroid 5-alpha reductase family enzyme